MLRYNKSDRIILEWHDASASISSFPEHLWKRWVKRSCYVRNGGKIVFEAFPGSHLYSEVAFVVAWPGKLFPPQLVSLLPASVPTAPLGQRGKWEQGQLPWAREERWVMQWWQWEEVTGCSGTKWTGDFLWERDVWSQSRSSTSLLALLLLSDFHKHDRTVCVSSQVLYIRVLLHLAPFYSC